MKHAIKNKNRFKTLHIIQNWASKPDFGRINYLRFTALRTALGPGKFCLKSTSPVPHVLQDTYTLKRHLQFCKADLKRGCVPSYWAVTSHMPIRALYEQKDNRDEISLWHRDSFSLSYLNDVTPNAFQGQFLWNGFVFSLISGVFPSGSGIAVNAAEELPYDLKQSKQHSAACSAEKFTAIWEPSPDQIRQHLQQLREFIRKGRTWTQLQLIQQLSPLIYAWKAYYEGMSARTQKQCDFILFKMLWRWACRRHPKKSRSWVKQKYFHCIKEKNWIFAVFNSETQNYVCLPSHLAE